ncbi:class I SAM-dependent methyltransferase [Candidatus Omnitrophota bacterium]
MEKNNKKTQEEIYSRSVNRLREDSSASFLEYPLTVQDTKKAKFLKLLDLDQDDRVLDVGCYAGGFSRFLNKYYRVRTVGIDLSFTCVQYCVKSDRFGNRFHVADAENLPFVQNSFDAVLSIAVLEHLSDLKKGISEIYRVLKNEGRAVIHLPVKDDKYTLMWLLRKVAPQRLRKSLESIGHDYSRIPTSRQLVRLLEEEGFIVKDTERVGHFIQPLHDWYVIAFLYRHVFSPVRNVLRNITGRKDRSHDRIRVKGNAFDDGGYIGSGAFRKAYSTVILPLVRILVFFERLVGFRGGYCIYILAMKPQ